MYCIAAFSVGRGILQTDPTMPTLTTRPLGVASVDFMPNMLTDEDRFAENETLCLSNDTLQKAIDQSIRL